MPEQGIRIKIQLCIQRDDVTRAREDQWVDFRQRRVGFPERFIETLQGDSGAGDRRIWNTDFVREIIGLLIGQADGRIDLGFENLLRSVLGNFFDIHAAFTRGHHHGSLATPINHQADVILVANIGAFFDQETTNLLALRSGLMRHQLHPQDFARAGANVFHRFGHFDPAALAAPASVNLSFNDPNRASKGFCGTNRFIDGMASDASRHLYAIALENFFALVFVDFHRSDLCRQPGARALALSAPNRNMGRTIRSRVRHRAPLAH